MDVTTKIGRNPVSKHQIQSEYGNEQADTGQEYRTRLARTNSQARTGTEKLFFPVQLNTCRIDNFTRLIHTLAICDDHTIKFQRLEEEELVAPCIRVLKTYSLGFPAFLASYVTQEKF